jgi:hypothetical protein
MKNEQVSTPVEPLGRAFASTRAVLVQVQAGQLEAPTPCVSWDVRALIEHRDQPDGRVKKTEMAGIGGDNLRPVRRAQVSSSRSSGP